MAINATERATATATGPRRSERPGFEVLSRADLRLRARVRRARLLVVVSACLVLGALLLVAGAQALVDTGQLRLDNARQQLSSAVSTNQNLELERAQLSSPARILGEAEQRLKMVAPSSVSYLTPVDPGASASKAGSSKGASTSSGSKTASQAGSSSGSRRGNGTRR